jgi:predicted ATPase
MLHGRQRTFPRQKSFLKIIYQKTDGNPFFTIQFIRMLHEEDYFQMNYLTCEFEFDVSRIKMETNVAENVADLISGKLRALPEITGMHYE